MTGDHGKPSSGGTLSGVTQPQDEEAALVDRALNDRSPEAPMVPVQGRSPEAPMVPVRQWLLPEDFLG